MQLKLKMFQTRFKVIQKQHKIISAATKYKNLYAQVTWTTTGKTERKTNE